MKEIASRALAELVFAAWRGDATARARIKAIATLAEDARWDEQDGGDTVIAKSYSGITCGIDFRSDPVTLAVSVAFLLYGQFWPKVLPDYLGNINELWRESLKVVEPPGQSKPSPRSEQPTLSITIEDDEAEGNPT